MKALNSSAWKFVFDLGEVVVTSDLILEQQAFDSSENSAW